MNDRYARKEVLDLLKEARKFYNREEYTESIKCLKEALAENMGQNLPMGRQSESLKEMYMKIVLRDDVNSAGLEGYLDRLDEGISIGNKEIEELLSLTCIYLYELNYGDRQFFNLAFSEDDKVLFWDVRSNSCKLSSDVDAAEKIRLIRHGWGRDEMSTAEALRNCSKAEQLSATTAVDVGIEVFEVWIEGQYYRIYAKEEMYE